MSYTDQTAIQAFLVRDLTSAEVTMLPMLIAAVTNYLDGELSGSYGEATSSTRYYDGGSRIINIQPVQNVTKVAVVDSDESESTVYELNGDFELRPRNATTKRWLQSRVGKFPAGVANIAVTGEFTLGATVPDDIKYLATYLAGRLMDRAAVTGLKSESIEGYSRTFGEITQENPVISMLLAAYTQGDVLL